MILKASDRDLLPLYLQADAAKEGELVIRKLVKLIIRYGDKQNAGWLELLGEHSSWEPGPMAPASSLCFCASPSAALAPLSTLSNKP